MLRSLLLRTRQAFFWLALTLLVATPLFAQTEQKREDASSSDSSTSESQAEAQEMSTEEEEDGEVSDEDAMKLQIALAEANFSPGPVDGMWGMNTQKALTAYQRAHGLEATGELDDASRKALKLDSNRAWMVDYTITDEDLSVPMVSSIPDKPSDKAKMKSLGYTSAAEALAEKFRLDQDTLEELNSDVELKAGATIRVPDLANVALPSIAEGDEVKIVVSRQGDYLELYDSSGKVVFFAPATAGSSREPLPLGNWEVIGIAHDPTFRYDPDLLLDADPNSKVELLPPGPNNPVGKVWIALNKEHYGIHGTPEPAQISRKGSSGCVRLANWDVLQLAELISEGTAVHFKE